MTETTAQASESPTLAPERIRRILQQNGLEVAESRWALLERWAELLREHNQRINLVSRKEEGVIWEKHLLPCLALLCLREFPEGVDVCDFVFCSVGNHILTRGMVRVDPCRQLVAVEDS